MSPLDFIKATLVCACIAYLVYCYPVLGQAVIIFTLCILWLSYLYRTVVSR